MCSLSAQHCTALLCVLFLFLLLFFFFFFFFACLRLVTCHSGATVPIIIHSLFCLSIYCTVLYCTVCPCLLLIHAFLFSRTGSVLYHTRLSPHHLIILFSWDLTLFFMHTLSYSVGYASLYAIYKAYCYAVSTVPLQYCPGSSTAVSFVVL